VLNGERETNYVNFIDSHICPEVSAKGRYGPGDDIRADRVDMGIGM
jgi:hypothetical protein